MKAATKWQALYGIGRVFQSTPPVKAATEAVTTAFTWALFQSTPPVKAATLSPAHRGQKVFISIHAAREGGDIKHGDNPVDLDISIHAAREGGDCKRLFLC